MIDTLVALIILVNGQQFTYDSLITIDKNFVPVPYVSYDSAYDVYIDSIFGEDFNGVAFKRFVYYLRNEVTIVQIMKSALHNHEEYRILPGFKCPHPDTFEFINGNDIPYSTEQHWYFGPEGRSPIRRRK